MRVRLGTLIQANQSMSHLAQQSLPALASYRVLKVARAMEAAFADYRKAVTGVAQRQQEALKDIPPTDSTALASAKLPFDQEVASLLQEEIDIPSEKISLADLHTAKIPPIHLAQLEWLIQDPLETELPPA